MKIKNKKNKRIKICDIEDLDKNLIKEGYNIKVSDYENFKDFFIGNFNINDKLFNEIYKVISEKNITYKVNDISDFIVYINNVLIFEEEHKILCKKIGNIKILNINRVEYDRIPSAQDDVEHILKIIEKTKKDVSRKINKEGKIKLEELEKEIDEDYIYSKDIELLKKMITFNNKNIYEEYDEINKIKSIFIKIPKEITFDYVTAQKGSVEYHEHIKSYISRMRRLIKNIDKYLIKEDENDIFKINQSSTIQDSVNMAVAIFNGKEFRAISGKNDIKNSCLLIPQGKEKFESCKVNKLGKLGIGYNRVNDSEKKIIEEINNLIELGNIQDKGELILYSKWEPCPSCYYVISQFTKKYPNINLKVRYNKRYGE